MKRALIAFGIVALLATSASIAWAVNLRPIPVAGVYSIRGQAPSDADMAQVCLDRVDAANTKLERLSCLPASPSEIITFSITVPVTPGLDAVLRAVAIDQSGNESVYSTDTAVLDFTAPAIPSFVE